MILLLVIAAAPLHFPALRRGVGAFFWGALMTLCLIALFGVFGAFLPWGSAAICS
jgi:hypothetical protein